MTTQKNTPTPWYVGAQNDALYITAGRPPAKSNDDPWHDAPRVAIARVFTASPGDVLPVNADANAAFIVRAVNAHDALVKALAELRDLVRSGEMPAYGDLPQVDLVSRSYVTLASAVETVCDAALKAAGEP